MYSEESVSPIDFSLFGYGIREMDLGAYLCMIEDSQLISSILEGYESVSEYKINKEYLDICKVVDIIIYHNKIYENKKFQANMDRWCSTIFSQII